MQKIVGQYYYRKAEILQLWPPGELRLVERDRYNLDVVTPHGRPIRSFYYMPGRGWIDKKDL